MTKFDLSFWRFVLSVVQMIGIVVIGIYAWWTNREKVTGKRFKALEVKVGELVASDGTERCVRRGVRIDDLEDRVLTMETDLKHMPTHDHLQGLSEDIGQLRSQLSEFSGRMKGINRAVDLINQFLLEHGGNK